MKKITILLLLVFFSNSIIAVDKNPCDLQFLDQQKLLACLADMAKQIKQLKEDNQKLRLFSTTDKCTSETQGHIRSDGKYMRFCNGKDWKVIDARDSRAVLKHSKEKYTMAAVRELTEGYNIKNPKRYGQSNICETGYHLCIFMEALTIKYAYPRSRINLPTKESINLRTLGTSSFGVTAGNTIYNAIIGFGAVPKWDGERLQCHGDSGPVITFSSYDDNNLGHQFAGGCYEEDKLYWACCINNLD